MSSAEFDPAAHEQFVSERLSRLHLQIARVALFDELIDMYHDGMCSFEEAIEQFKHDSAIMEEGEA